MVMSSVPTTTGGTAATPATVAMGGALADEEPPRFLPRGRLDDLLALLREDGRRVIGPTVGEGADRLRRDRLGGRPAGRLDRSPGTRPLSAGADRDRTCLRLRGRADDLEALDVPASCPADDRTAGRRPDHLRDAVPEPPPLAFLGVRGCELAALRQQDRVLARGPFVDGDYAARRATSLIVAVECVAPAETCFCTSMGTGPEVTGGYDLRLTELDDGLRGPHRLGRPGPPS